MPLLHKKPFVPNDIPEDLKDNDSVFFCKLTKEMFTDYDDFCERIILCNSLVWSCSLTGRSNLTFQEALNSEEKIKTLLKKFPHELRIPVLYLASRCERKSLIEMTEDVYCFVKDRYFIGENVQVTLEDNEIPCRIVSVSPPNEQELAKCPKTNHDKNGDRTFWPPGHLYEYVIEFEGTGERQSVAGGKVSRKKSAYSKDKNRLYIKQFVHSSDGLWKLKASVATKYGINDVKFDEIFCGEPPNLSPKVTSPKKSKASNKQQSINKYFKPSDKKYAPMKKGSNSSANSSKLSKVNGMKQRRRRRTKAEMIEINKSKPRLAEDKEKLKQLKREERLKQAQVLKEWNKKREDLECEDLRELPTPLPVSCRIPHEQFGEALMILEFLHNFKKLVPVKDFFPHGVNLELIERALMEDEIAGPFSDLVQLLLVTIFDLIEQESEEVKEVNIKLSQNNQILLDRGVRETQDMVKMATSAHAWIRLHHGGMALKQLPLDTATLTEVLRLHILSSGSKPNDKTQKWRYQARGGYCNYDDPAIELKAFKPNLIRKLGYTSVCQLPIIDKVAIIDCLINQVIMYSSMRDFFEENCEVAKRCRLKIRAITVAEVKKEKELKILKKKRKEGNPSESAKPEGGGEDDEEEAVGGNWSLRGKISTDPENKSKEDLQEEMSRAISAAQLTPLGTDRAYRKFWKFSCIPGLFVEHYETNPGPCLPKVTPATSDETLLSMKHLLERDNSVADNKENLSAEQVAFLASSTPNQSKKHLVESNGVASPNLNNWNNYCVNESKDSSSFGGNRLTCWSDPRICPVHSLAESTRHRWFFFKDPADIDSLIENLNRRGIRERHLRVVLQRERKAIVESLPELPVDTLYAPVKREDEGGSATSGAVSSINPLSAKLAKAYENANMSYPLGTCHEDMLENLLRDTILETEVEMYAGALGSLKVKNRMKWRSAIESKSYDKQCKKLTWGGKFNTKAQSDGSVKDDNSSEDGSKKDGESVDGSRCCTPTLDLPAGVLESEIDNASSLLIPEDGFKQKPSVSDLACAILQLEQAFDHKHLKRPLGLDLKERDKGDVRMPTPALERWECAVMQSTSFPQLFLHLSTLDNSVIWARSALKAYCKICRKKSNPEDMLLCDTCFKGHHLYCLKPKLTKVPSGDWHCPTCKPKVKVSPVKKKPRKFFSEGSDEESDTEMMNGDEEETSLPCKGCSDPGSELECGSCDSTWHLACVNPPMRKVPKSRWFCHACRIANSMANNSVNSTAANTPNNSTPGSERTSSKRASRPSTPSHIEEASESGAEDEAKSTNVSKSSPTSQQSGRRRAPVNFVQNDHTERTSRRKSSKAASERIHKFAKQLRTANASTWNDDDDDYHDEDEEKEGSEDGEEVSRKSRSRRSRRTLDKEDEALPLDNAALQEILGIIMHDTDCWPFLRPVLKSEAPDYHSIIKKPMDFGTIKHKLNMLEYTKNSEVISDAMLIFRNCYEYNEEGNEVYDAGKKLEAMFKKLCEENNVWANEEDSDLLNGGNPRKKQRLY